jgi:hypothetical protein
MYRRTQSILICHNNRFHHSPLQFVNIQKSWSILHIFCILILWKNELKLIIFDQNCYISHGKYVPFFPVWTMVKNLIITKLVVCWSSNYFSYHLNLWQEWNETESWTLCVIEHDDVCKYRHHRTSWFCHSLNLLVLRLRDIFNIVTRIHRCLKVF